MKSGSWVWVTMLLAALVSGLGCGEEAADVPAEADQALSGHGHRHGHGKPHGSRNRELVPVAECVVKHGHRGFVALFGYANLGDETAVVPVGRDNRLAGDLHDEQSQPTHLSPGRQRGAFTAASRGGAVIWKLASRIAHADRHIRRCGPDETALAGEIERMKDYFRRLYPQSAVAHRFMEPTGYGVDCLDRLAQPGLAGGVPLRTAPPNPIPAMPALSAAEASLPRVSGGVDDDGNERRCPAGTIPVRQFALEEARRFGTLEQYLRRPFPTHEGETHRRYHSTIETNGVAVIGSRAAITVEDPFVDDTLTYIQDHSISQMWLLRPACGTACGEAPMQSIESGWRKAVLDDGPRFFIYFTADEYVNTGCYNLECTGFVQTDGEMILDGDLAASDPPLPRPRQRRFVSMQWTRDETDGNWWLSLAVPGEDTPRPIGYYPGSLYNAAGLASSAIRSIWGGEVHDTHWDFPGFAHTPTQMGNGASPKESGAGDAATQSGLALFRVGEARFRGATPLTLLESGPPCYTLTAASAVSSDDPDNPAVFIQFGGDGLDCR